MHIGKFSGGGGVEQHIHPPPYLKTLPCLIAFFLISAYKYENLYKFSFTRIQLWNRGYTGKWKRLLGSVFQRGELVYIFQKLKNDLFFSLPHPDSSRKLSRQLSHLRRSKESALWNSIGAKSNAFILISSQLPSGSEVADQPALKTVSEILI